MPILEGILKIPLTKKHGIFMLSERYSNCAITVQLTKHIKNRPQRHIK